MKPMDWLRRRPEGFWVTVIILAVLAVGAVLTWVPIGIGCVTANPAAPRYAMSVS